MTRLASAACAAAALLMTLTACGGGSGGGTTGGGSTGTTSGGPTTSPSGVGPSPSWRSRYTAAELKQYDAAVAFWHKYQKAAAPLWAAGKATPQAEATFERYMTPLNAKASYGNLSWFQRQHEQLTGQPAVLWAQATKIQQGLVELSECVDYSKSQITVNGMKAAFPFSGPVIRRVGVEQRAGRQGLSMLGEPSEMKMETQPCSPA